MCIAAWLTEWYWFAEKRAQFDQGVDPLDPEEQANQHGGHHWHQGGGFNPFGQGGFNFKFHFN